MSARSWSRSNGSRWKCWFFRIIIKKNFRNKGENQQSTHIWRRPRDLNRSPFVGRQLLSQNHCTTSASKNDSALTYTSYNFSIPSLIRCENITKALSLSLFFCCCCCCCCYFVTDRFLIYLPLSEARDWNPCPPPALSLQLNVDFIVHSNSTLYLEHSTERYFCPLLKDHRVWREADVLYLYRRATICSNKTGNKLTFGQISDGLVRFRIISISSKLFGYPGCLWGPLDHDIGGPYHNKCFMRWKNRHKGPVFKIQTDEMW